MNTDYLKKMDEAIAVASKYRNELLTYAGVVAVGAGPKRRGGKIVDEAAILITVRRKKGLAELQALGEKPLPEILEGFSIDVIEFGKPIEATDILQAQVQAKKLIVENSKKWLQIPNVTAVGYGYKETKGKVNFNIIALKFFVKKKMSLEELKKSQLQPIPQEIEGVPTDVIEMSMGKPSAASGSRGDKHDPLKGGVAVGVQSRPFHYGTYGATVFDRTTGEAMVLGNQHVLDAVPGTHTIQPSPVSLDDSVEVGFQLDICNPLHFIRLDTPNTTVGSILAGGAAAAALAAALSDEIDPTRRGQEETVPPGGALTQSETHQVKMNYLNMPIPGTHFKIKTSWKYIRQTNLGVQPFQVEEIKQNAHALYDKLLITDRKLYKTGDTIRIYGLIIPEKCMPHQPEEAPGLAANSEHLWASVAATSRCRCDAYHTLAILAPTKVDKAFSVVLKAPVSAQKNQLLQNLLNLIRERNDEALLQRVFRLIRYGCFYTGTFHVMNIPIGPWKHYFYVQTVNIANEHMKPTEAAQIIGGLPVSQNAKADLDIACGPIVYEDGEFDVELI